MRSIGPALLGSALLACGGSGNPVECLIDENCNLPDEEDGVCLAYEPSGSKWCTYASPDCPSGRRWSDYNTGDGLSGVCVDAEAVVDAGQPDGGDGPDANVDAAGTDAPPPIDGGVIVDMITIPAGAFYQGCNDANPNPYTCDSLQLDDEIPYHQVTLSEYEIDRTEVTQAQWAECVDSTACVEPAPVASQYDEAAGYDPAVKPDHPVTNITWAQAKAYCEWRSKRLPTEAEWEKACRGTDGRMNPWGDSAPTCDEANLGTLCAGNGTHAVGSHLDGASFYGVLDMSGNAAEWVSDFYSDTYYASAPATDPQGPLSGTQRVYRGGGYPHSTNAGRCADRSSSNVADYPRGFRCAR